MFSPDQQPSPEQLDLNNKLAEQFEQIISQRKDPETNYPHPADELLERGSLENVTKIANESGFSITKEELEQRIRLGRYAASQHKTVDFSPINPRDVYIGIELAYESVARALNSGVFGVLPESFRFPAVAITTTPNRLLLPTTTPYGKLPSYAIDINNRLYEFTNTLFLNKFGQGVKYEMVERVSSKDEPIETVLKNYELKLEDVPRLNIVMSPENNRIVQIEDEDYVKLQEYLDKIKAGEFREN